MPLVLDECAVFQIFHRLAQFILRIHDDRSMLSDGLLDRLARNK